MQQNAFRFVHMHQFAITHNKIMITVTYINQYKAREVKTQSPIWITNATVLHIMLFAYALVQHINAKERKRNQTQVWK